MDRLTDFSTFDFAAGGRSRRVYRKGTGPGVVVMHEMPGITPEVATFSRRVAEAGFTVFMPSLFGRDGEKASGLGFVREFAKLCIGREFALLAANRASPVVDWVGALARHVHSELGGKGVGAIGMCITGNFALTMALDPQVAAPVLSQPSLPWPPLGDNKAALHAPNEALEAVRRRHREDGFRVIGLRFDGDKRCPKARFDTLKRELGAAFEPRELPDGSARTRPKHPHSVLTKELIDEAGQATHEALERVIDLFRERL